MASALPPTDAAGRFSRTLLLLRRERMLTIGIGISVLMFLVALFPDLFTSLDPRDTDALAALEPPSSEHWFGTDTLGRDVFSRVVHGTRTSVGIAGISVGFALLVGSTLGLAAGYFGGIVDQILGRVMDVVFSLPALLLAVAIAGILGPSVRNAIIAIGIVYTPHFFRVARSGSIAMAARPFVLASRLLGATDRRILTRHILPNTSALLTVQTTVSLAYAILLEASLSFLGLGVQPPNPSWGSILNEGRPFLQLSPWMSIFPGLMILFAVLAVNLVSDTLRDRWDTSQGVRG
jgi:peptide/nickel transport system permease protein